MPFKIISLMTSWLAACICLPYFLANIADRDVLVTALLNLPYQTCQEPLRWCPAKHGRQMNVWICPTCALCRHVVSRLVFSNRSGSTGSTVVSTGVFVPIQWFVRMICLAGQGAWQPWHAAAKCLQVLPLRFLISYLLGQNVKIENRFKSCKLKQQDFPTFCKGSPTEKITASWPLPDICACIITCVALCNLACGRCGEVVSANQVMGRTCTVHGHQLDKPKPEATNKRSKTFFISSCISPLQKHTNIIASLSMHRLIH